MGDLAEFLLARIAEDEAAARAILADYGSITGWLERDHDSAAEQVAALDLAPWLSRFDPARVLAECEAKRRIVERWRETAPTEAVYGGTGWGDAYTQAIHETLDEDVLPYLALPYADHPDFREEWRA